MKEEGHFTLVHFGRLSVPADIERKWGIYRGYATSYQEAKQKYESIPKEQHQFPYISASRVVVVFPHDATKNEVLRSLEFLLSDLKERWKEDSKGEE